MDNLQTYIITRKGKFHAANQDAANILMLDDAVFLVIADGVSTSNHGKDAARTVVKEVCEYINRNYQSCSIDFDYRLLLFNAFCHALKYFSDNNLNLYLYATTLSVALLQEDGTTHIGHVGDGGIITQEDNATWHYVTHQMPLKHSDNAVIPFSRYSAWEFITLNHKVKSVFLATDGALPTLLDADAFVKGIGDKRMQEEKLLDIFRKKKSWDDDATVVAAIMENM